MKSTLPALALAFTAGLFPPAPLQLDRNAAIAKAEKILEHLQNDRSADVVREFDARMTAELPAAKLEPAWRGVIAQFGPFKGIVERREGRVKDRQTVELFLAFEKDTIVQRAVFDGDGKLSGLVFRPVTASVLPPAK
jgi:hypothetical protein